LGYLDCFENYSFISHISPKKVATSEKLTEHNVQNEDSLQSEIENPSSNLLEICSYISSFLHCCFVQTKTSFLLELTWQKLFSITYKSSMKTTRQSFQMIAHCLFTSIDSNEKFREIRMQVIAG
jgi:GTPase SAR1 family protein